METSCGDSESDSMESVSQLYDSTLSCIGVNFLEGCCIGGALSGVVSVLPALVKGRFRGLHKKAFSSANLRVTVFFGTLMALCNGLMHLERARKRLEQPGAQVRLRALIGIIAGSSVAMLPAGVRRFLVYLLFTRCLEVLVRARRIPDDEGEVLSTKECVGLAMASMSVVTTGWFGWPQSVPKGYLRFLDTISNIHKDQFRDLGLALRGVPEQREGLVEHLISHPCCSILHSERESCPRFTVRMFLKGFVTRTVPFYIKVYQFPLLFSVLKNPKKFSPRIAARHYMRRVLRSALFLATLNTMVASTVCGVSNLNKRVHLPLALGLPLSGCISGVSLLVEQPGRRLELALYLFAQALQISANAYTAAGLPSSRAMDIPVSAVSIAAIVFAFWEKEESHKFWALRDSYSHLLNKIFDTKDKRHSFRLAA